MEPKFMISEVFGTSWKYTKSQIWVLVGSAIWKNLEEKGYTNLIGKTHTELDLLDGVAVDRKSVV